MHLLKKVSLFGIIGFLSLSALVAVVSLLTGDFGDTQVRIILTTLTISGASVCGMACFAFIEKRGLAPLGAIGVGCAVAAAAMGILAIWDITSPGTTYGKVALTLVVAAVALAHAFLLHIPTLPPGYRWNQYALILFDLLLAGQITFALWDETNASGFYRIMGVITVFVVLFTLIIPICSRLGGGHATKEGSLVLSHENNDIYRDEEGQRYRVTKV